MQQIMWSGGMGLQSGTDRTSELLGQLPVALLNAQRQMSYR